MPVTVRGHNSTIESTNTNRLVAGVFLNVKMKAGAISAKDLTPSTKKSWWCFRAWRLTKKMSRCLKFSDTKHTICPHPMSIILFNNATSRINVEALKTGPVFRASTFILRVKSLTVVEVTPSAH